MKNLIYIFILFSFQSYSQKTTYYYSKKMDLVNIGKNTIETKIANAIVKVDVTSKIITIAFENAATGKVQTSNRRYYESYLKDGNKGYNIKDEGGTAILLINFDESNINFLDVTKNFAVIFYYNNFEVIDK